MKITSYLYTLIGYISIASGIFISPLLYYSTYGTFEQIVSVVFMSIFIYSYIVSDIYRWATNRTIVFFLPIMVFYLANFIRSDYPDLLFSKYDGAVLSVLVSLPSYVVAIVRSGVEPFLKIYIRISVFILAATLIYKLNFGFWDREVRFFLNGPIVFGWLMGQSAILGAYVFLRGKKSVLNLVTLLAFVLSILWSQSKGPLISLVASVFALTRLNVLKRDFWIILLTCLLAALSIIVYAPENYTSRLYAISRYFSGDLLESDWGSLGARSEMWSAAMEVWSQNPVAGVGVGNWVKYSVFGEMYPHNILMEMLAEGGLVYVIITLFLVVSIFLRTEFIGRILLVYFMLCLTFSGDYSYMRMLFSFPLALVFARKFLSRSEPARLS